MNSCCIVLIMVIGPSAWREPPNSIGCMPASPGSDEACLSAMRPALPRGGGGAAAAAARASVRGGYMGTERT